MRQLHKIYSKGRETQDPVKPKNNPVAIKFKSENEKKPEPITSNYVNPNMIQTKSVVLNESASGTSVIKQIN